MRNKRCKDCRGTGKDLDNEYLCDTCGGSGYEQEQEEKFYGKLDFSG